MKKFRIAAVILIILSFMFIVSSCSDSMGEMIDDYNSYFIPIIDGTSNGLRPGDEGYDPSTMLQDMYIVAVDSTLCLYAPMGCESYSWKVYAPSEKSIYEGGGNETETSTEREVELPRSVDVTARSFMMYIKDSPLEAGVTYKVVLEVTDAKGNSYKDTCDLVIYRRYGD